MKQKIIPSLTAVMLGLAGGAAMAQASALQDASSESKAHDSTGGHTRGETGRGQGSGVTTPNKAEGTGEQRAQSREAKPHGHTSEATMGQTGRGEGSGIVRENKAENAAQKRADVREAQPHKDTTQGGTPQ